MLGRAATRSLRVQAQHSPSSNILSQRNLLPKLPARSYAKNNKPSKPAATLSFKSGSPIPPTTGAARQTSPGTALPHDQTWKPKDSIKFGGPAATAAAATSRPTGTEGDRAGDAADFSASASPAENTVPQGQPGPVHPSSQSTPADTTRNTQSLQDTQSTPPIEQELASGGGSQTGQAPEANAEPEAPLQPLPDLRQGIPSTFDAEFLSQSRKPAEDDDAASASIDAIPGRARRSRDEESYEASDYETSTDRTRARWANYLYLSIAALLLTGSAYLSRPYGDDEDVPPGLSPENVSSWGPAAMYLRARSRMTGSMEYYTEPTFRKLLPDIPEAQRPPMTLVLSLEDLMIHSGWTREHGWRTAKRPGIDYFLRYLSQYYELVVFTSVPSTMADPFIKKLDPFHIIMWPLFREATRYENGDYVKDLAYLNRPLDKVIMIDTKAGHVKKQPENAIILPKWKGDPKDPNTGDLVALIPFLEYIATMGVQDARKVLESFQDTSIPHEFARREAKAREEFNAQLAAESSRRPKKSLGGLFSSALGVKPQPGGMTLDNETSVAEGLSQGKMLSDQIRERGQREYERLEREIQLNGAKWLKEMEEEEKRMMESSMKDMRNSWFGGITGGKGGAPIGSETEKRQ